MGIRSKAAVVGSSKATAGLMGVAVVASTLWWPSGCFTTQTEPTLVAHAVPLVCRACGPGAAIPWKFSVCNVGTEERKLDLRVDGTEIVITSPPSSVSPGGCEDVTVSVKPPATQGWTVRPIRNGTQHIGDFAISTRVEASDTLPVTLAQPAEAVSVSGGRAQIKVDTDKANNMKSTTSIPAAWRLQAGPWYANGVVELAAGSRVLQMDVRGQTSFKRLAWQVWPISRQGTLTLVAGREKGAAGPVVEAVFPVSVRLSAYDTYAQGVVTTVLTFLPLLFGGLLAYLLRTVVPQTRRRQKLLDLLTDTEEELKVLHQKGQPYPDVAVLLREDVRRTLTTLRSFLRFSPELGSELETLEARAGELRLKAAALRRVAALPRSAGFGLGLLALDEVRGAAQAVIQELRAARGADAPLQNALARLDAAEATVGSSRVDLQACKLEYSIVSPK